MSLKFNLGMDFNLDRLQVLSISGQISLARSDDGEVYLCEDFDGVLYPFSRLLKEEETKNLQLWKK